MSPKIQMVSFISRNRRYNLWNFVLLSSNINIYHGIQRRRSHIRLWPTSDHQSKLANQHKVNPKRWADPISNQLFHILRTKTHHEKAGSYPSRDTTIFTNQRTSITIEFLERNLDRKCHKRPYSFKRKNISEYYLAIC